MTSERPILYAEDDENDVFLLERACARAGITHPLYHVRDGRSVIDYLTGSGPFAQREPTLLPSLILLDLKMLGKSGLEVLDWIRAQPRFASVPVVMLTSSNLKSDVQTAYDCGANGYLVKPGKPEDLLIMVKSMKDHWLTGDRTLPLEVVKTPPFLDGSFT